MRGRDGDIITGLFFVSFALFAMSALLFHTGGFDNEETWTASDMRGEVQRRLERINEDIEEAKERDAESWEIIRLGAERAELMAITEPYE